MSNPPSRPTRLSITPELMEEFGRGKLEAGVEEELAEYLEQHPEFLNLVPSHSAEIFVSKLREVYRRPASIGPKDLQQTTSIHASKSQESHGKLQRDDAKRTHHPVAPELASCAAYKVIKELGRGGMGVVYLAKNVQMDRLEVLKVLSESSLNQ